MLLSFLGPNFCCLFFQFDEWASTCAIQLTALISSCASPRPCTFIIQWCWWSSNWGQLPSNCAIIASVHFYLFTCYSLPSATKLAFPIHRAVHVSFWHLQIVVLPTFPRLMQFFESFYVWSLPTTAIWMSTPASKRALWPCFYCQFW